MFTIGSAISVLPRDDAVTRHVCRRAEKAQLAENFFGRPGLAERLAEKPAD